MYFDQYFIKPAFATLTSLLRTYSAHNLTVAFIYLRVSVSESLSCLSSVSSVSIFFCLPSATSAASAFLPFLSVGSAKVGIFF